MLFDGLENVRQQFVPSLSLLGGERNHRSLLLQFQNLPNGFQVGLDLAFLQLVQLIGNDHVGLARLLEILSHGHIDGRRLVPGIHDQHAQRDQLRVGEIGLDQLGPPLLFRLGHLGVAVAGKIHQVHGFINKEIVDVGGLARGFTDTGKIFPQQQLVDDGGLTHIGAARKGKLGHTVPHKAALIGGRADKLRFCKIQCLFKIFFTNKPFFINSFFNTKIFFIDTSISIIIMIFISKNISFINKLF